VGSAFESQPVRGDSILVSQIKPNIVPIGGDYWQNLPYHIGYEESYLIISDSRSTGKLYSNPFIVPQGAKSIDFLISGTTGRVEIEFQQTPKAWVSSGYVVYPDSRSVLMQRKSIILSPSDGGKIGRILIWVPSPGNHILVDDFKIVAAKETQMQEKFKSPPSTGQQHQQQPSQQQGQKIITPNQKEMTIQKNQISGTSMALP
jgi:hypothetical protein